MNDVQGATSTAAVPAAAASTANLSATHSIDEYELLCGVVCTGEADVEPIACPGIETAGEVGREGIMGVFSIV